MREGKDVAFTVLDEPNGKNVEVKKQFTENETLKLFRDSSFDYLFNANYLTTEYKEELLRLAGEEGIIDKMDAGERHATIKAQQNLTSETGKHKGKSTAIYS